MSERAEPLRLWPGLVLAALLLIARLGLPLLWPDGTPFALIGAVLFGLLIVLWWGFFSRAPRFDRWGGVALVVAALAATWSLAHVSIATGAMGFMVPLTALPLVGVALAAWAVASRGLGDTARRISMSATIIVASGALLLLRTEGMTSTFLGSDLRWRWTPTPEERLLATAAPLPQAAVEAPIAVSTPAPVAAEPATPAPGASSEDPGRAPVTAAAPPSSAPSIDWPGFRGPRRDSIVRGTRIDTDWVKSPPVALWRRPIGPGWSSFSVAGDLIYTQEQRGDTEMVTCYRLSTGEPVWTHREPVRFWESNGGAGPRATPTLDGGRVYALGATGILNVLNAASGARIWSRDIASDSHIAVPDWGFSSSPLLVDDLVIVAAAGKLVAYDRATGSPRWSGDDGGPGYSSPQLMTIGGVPQVVLLTGRGAASYAPSDGTRLWDLVVPASSLSATVVQPAITSDGDILVADGEASRMRRVAAGMGSAGWRVEERWSSNGLKPFFNDFVIHKGHAYGFDGTILSAIDVADGQRKWKGGRYGNGQLLLLADQDLLLVMTEDGDLAMVSATPDRFTEIAARVPAISGKTWNHPVLINNVLIVRNGEEMAAFRLPGP